MDDSTLDTLYLVDACLGYSPLVGNPLTGASLAINDLVDGSMTDVGLELVTSDDGPKPSWNHGSLSYVCMGHSGIYLV